MNSIKVIFLNALTLIIGVVFLSLALTHKSRETPKFETIPAFKISQLNQFKGQYINVLYVVGTQPLTSNNPLKINISQIKDTKSALINSDTLTWSKTQILKEGYRPSYNMVLVVISPKPNFSWKNLNEVEPLGYISTKNHQVSYIKAFSKSSLKDYSISPRSHLAYNLLIRN